MTDQKPQHAQAPPPAAGNERQRAEHTAKHRDQAEARHTTPNHTEHDTQTHSKRDRIMQAALELFTERGFHGTPMPLVAERAAVAAGTIYRYFESKEALVNAIFQYWHARGEDYVFASRPVDLALREQFHVLFRRYVDFSLTHPVAMAFLNLHYHSPYLDDASRQCVERGRQHALEFFQAATAAQLTKPLPPELLFFVVDGVFMGLFRAHLAGLIKLDGHLIDMVEACAWAAVQR